MLTQQLYNPSLHVQITSGQLSTEKLLTLPPLSVYGVLVQGGYTNILHLTEQTLTYQEV